MLNDTLVVSGKTIENPLNQEVAAMRGLLPGEYIVNVHYYESETNESVPVRKAKKKRQYALRLTATVQSPMSISYQKNWCLTDGYRTHAYRTRRRAGFDLQ